MLREYGYSEYEASNLITMFAQHDKTLLEKTLAQDMTMEQVIETSKQGREELITLFTKDKQSL